MQNEIATFITYVEQQIYSLSVRFLPSRIANGGARSELTTGDLTGDCQICGHPQGTDFTKLHFGLKRFR
jgi:hypothetical protein